MCDTVLGLEDDKGACGFRGFDKELGAAVIGGLEGDDCTPCCTGDIIPGWLKAGELLAL